MYCKYCGTEVSEGSLYCQSCGMPVGEEKSGEVPVREEERGTKPSNYLLLGILTTLFCCFPFGIVSIIYSSKTDDAWRAGDYDGARSFSRKARRFALWGMFWIVVVFVLYIIVVLVISLVLNEPIQELFDI